MLPSKIRESKTEAEALILDGNTNVKPPYCLFRNHQMMKDKMLHLVQRTYEHPYYWYYMTFKPFDKMYNKYLDFYTNKGFDHVRKKIGKNSLLILTREIKATKIHINAIVVSSRPLGDLHEKHTNKYYIYSKRLPEMPDRLSVFNYIIKESKERFFYKNVDYYYHSA